MGPFDDLPLIRLKPAPTDAELQADRDAKHAVAVAHWFKEENEMNPAARTAAVLTAALTTLSAIGVTATPDADAVPLIGGNGLCPNAAALAEYVRVNYPGVLSIGGVRQDALPDHPSGHALDIMVGGNAALGNQIYGDVMSQRGRFGVRYVMWQQPQHFDHLHITVS